MKLRYEMTVLRMDDEPMAVPLADENEFRGILRMNDVTADILDVLSDDVTEEDIVSELLKEYDASEDEMRYSVKKVVDVLRENGLLAE